QALSTPSRGFDLPARAFTPPPKVDSTIVLFGQPTKPFDHIHELEKITQAAFSQRRKMLRSSLKPVFKERLKHVLESAGVKETQRAEEVTVEQYKNLAANQAVSTS
ncbi:MAG: 16S rRNA (adenine(1518)-N(6)/adenine(1519)-N(6))-dimethyltransferase, partial [Alphaproteobacteria bacterium]|nr:16S rRNA (adenine(1518)-N(6)/adenine(1519)-N(6))-dimethyltransferase [Alphaproteobacteria bacterium]